MLLSLSWLLEIMQDWSADVSFSFSDASKLSINTINDQRDQLKAKAQRYLQRLGEAKRKHARLILSHLCVQKAVHQA